MAPLALAGASACLSPPVAVPRTVVTQETPINVPQNPRNKVDVLFMVDNSASMSSMQQQLQMHFGDFLQVFEDLAKRGTYADLHIGVVTSDYGAGHTGKDKGASCDASPGGQAGKLQPLGAAASASCAPPMGAPFIKYAYGKDGPTSNLHPLADLATTFTCMASVGSGGCGFEHQLEAAYAALNNTSDNAGFLRDDALLTVVFVTNEDDGSAPPDTHIYDPPNSSSPDPVLGAYTTYRQTRFAIGCDGNLPPYGASGPFMSCATAPAALQSTALMSLMPASGTFDLSRYTNFFTLPKSQGGIKDVPAADVILVGITGPSEPVEIIVAQKSSGTGAGPFPQYVKCPSGSLPDQNDCIVALQHACQNSVDPAFFADPGVRINAVIKSAAINQINSICGEDLNQPPDYKKALQQLAEKIRNNLGTGCVPARLLNPTNPDCVVEDISAAAAGPIVIPTCASVPAGTFPCWKAEPKTECDGISPDGLGIVIDRNGVPAPPNTTASVTCSTIVE